MTDGPGRLVLNRGRIAILAGVLGAILLGVLINAVASGDAEEEIGAVMEEEATSVVLAYGRAPGGEACDYLSTEALERLGGEEGCQQHFLDAPSVDFDVQSLTVAGESADARVVNPRSGYPLDLELTLEEGAWRISYFQGLETILPSEQEEPLTTPTARAEPEGGTTEGTDIESAAAPPEGEEPTKQVTTT